MWCQYYFFLYWTNCNQHSFQYCYIIPEGTAHLQRLGGVLGLVVPKNKTQHHEKVQKMDLESHMILGRIGWFLFWWNLAFQFLHGFKLFHFVHRFQNCFCFRSTTFPSAVRTFGQRLLVLHCNYNGAVAPKFDLVITFDWGVVSTQGQCVWTAFCKIFSGIPHSPISDAPKYACQVRQICQIQPNTAKYGIWRAYLGEPYMVKWGIPEKILQNAVQTRWPCVNRTPQSKVMTKSNFGATAPL